MVSLQALGGGTSLACSSTRAPRSRCPRLVGRVAHPRRRPLPGPAPWDASAWSSEPPPLRFESHCATKSNRKLVRRVNRQSSCIHVRAQVAVTLHSNKSVERFHELMLRLERRRFNVSECERGRCVAAVADDGPVNAPKS